MFDPFKASFDKALEAEGLLEAEIDDPSRPIYQWSAANEIIIYEQQKDKMDGFDVLACIRKCLNHDLVVPSWLSVEFIKRYDAVLNCKSKSWDDEMAFGKPYRKGTNINALRKKRILSLGVYQDVKTLAQTKSTDEGLFEEVGKKHGIGKTLASEYYYYQVKKMAALNPK